MLCSGLRGGFPDDCLMELPSPHRNTAREETQMIRSILKLLGVAMWRNATQRSVAPPHPATQHLNSRLCSYKQTHYRLLLLSANHRAATGTKAVLLKFRTNIGMEQKEELKWFGLLSHVSILAGLQGLWWTQTSPGWTKKEACAESVWSWLVMIGLDWWWLVVVGHGWLWLVVIRWSNCGIIMLFIF